MRGGVLARLFGAYSPPRLRHSPEAIRLALQALTIVMEKAEAADRREYDDYGNHDRRTSRERLDSLPEHVRAETEGR
jgi:hypothetical protein